MLYLLRALENCQWWEGFVENVGFKPGVKEWVARGKTGESTEEKQCGKRRDRGGETGVRLSDRDEEMTSETR